MARNIDLSLNNLPVPGLDAYAQNFGTKVTIGEGISTEALADKDALPFLHQRAVIANEDLSPSTKNGSEVPLEADRRFIFTVSGTKVTLPRPNYVGGRVEFYAQESGSVTYPSGTSGTTTKSLSKGGFFYLETVEENGTYYYVPSALGSGITSLTQTTKSSSDGGTNVWTATMTDGSTSAFSVLNGSKGSTGADGKISVQTSAPASPSVGDIWLV